MAWVDKQSPCTKHSFHDKYHNPPVFIHKYALWNYPRNYTWQYDDKTYRYWTYWKGTLWTPYVKYTASNHSWIQWFDIVSWNEYNQREDIRQTMISLAAFVTLHLIRHDSQQ